MCQSPGVTGGQEIGTAGCVVLPIAPALPEQRGVVLTLYSW